MCADVCAGGEGDAQGSSGRAHDDSLKALPVQTKLCIFCGYLYFCAGMPLPLFE